MLKVSQYTCVESLVDHGLPLHVLAYSTRTSRSVVLTRSRWDSTCDQVDAKTHTSEEKNIAKLKSMGIFVDDDLDERDDLLNTFDLQRWRPQRIYPILAVTTGCNIACTYCYEEGVSASTMSTEVADATADWLVRRMQVDGIRQLYPTLFGGEPLLVPKLLYRIMDKVNSAADELGATVQYSCSSNGAYLSRDLARSLFRRRLSQIQISLDGTREVHDRRRAGKRGQSTYDSALAGLEIAAEYLPSATLKVNFDRQNINNIRSLLDEMAKRGLKDKIDVKFEAVAHQFPDSTVMHEPRHVIPPETSEMADGYTQLKVEARQRGFKISGDTAHTTPCMLTSHHGVIVGPDGSIYKCISLVGRENAAVGSVYDDEYEDAVYQRLMDVRTKTKQCYVEKCSYVPVCMGGCGYEASVRGGSPHDRYCTYENLKLYYFQQQLMQHEPALRKIGMDPLETQFAAKYPKIPMPSDKKIIEIKEVSY